jgi:hypothetical protein
MMLSLVPGGVGLLMGLLLLPRAAVPQGVPLPLAEPRQLVASRRADMELAARAHKGPLAGPVRALGSALRAFHVLEARGGDERDLAAARHDIDAALVEALPSGDEALLELRATQLEAFVAELHEFEARGVESAELQALAGGFVRSMRREGWCEGHRLLTDEFQVRAMFKQMWNGLAGLETRQAFELALDEERTLYAFYLSHPHPPAATREAIAEARRGARDSDACRALDEAEALAAEKWRLDRVGRLAAIDPQYPAAYARGIASFRSGQFVLASEAFESWLRDHPDGPYALRARSYLRRSLALTRVE